MNRKILFFRKFFSLITSFNLVFQSFFGLIPSNFAFAQNVPETVQETAVVTETVLETTPETTPEITEQPAETTPEVTPEVTVVPTEALPEESTPIPTLDLTVTPAEVSGELADEALKEAEVTPSPVPTPTPAQTLEVEKVCLTDEQIVDSINEDWNINLETGVAETKDLIKLGTKYNFPLENKVSVTFKCLPKDEDLRTSLKIQQVKVSDLKLPEGTNPYGEYAYDITTGMNNGDFEYDITLPKPENKTVGVSYFEDINDGIEIIEENKIDQENQTVKVFGLNHFSIYITTYSDTGLTIEKSEYLRGDTVYIKAGDLNSSKHYRIRIKNPAGNFPYLSNCIAGSSNIMNGEFLLPGDAEISSNWKAQLLRYNNPSDCNNNTNIHVDGIDNFSVVNVVTVPVFPTYDECLSVYSGRMNICHATSSPTNPFVGLNLPCNALYGNGGHIENNGSPSAGHELDTMPDENGLCGGQVVSFCVPIVEVCDGQDNDCDLQIDEDGVCGTCVWEEEICGDLIDNNCDGIIDDNCVSFCGNGVLEAGEDCDWGSQNGQGYCSVRCSWNRDCLTGVNMLINGGFETPVIDASQGWDILPAGTPGLGWQVEWHSAQTIYSGVTRPDIANLELHHGVNGWLTQEGSQYAELDTDWNDHTGTLNNEPASVKIYQDIPTIIGNRYEVKFWFSPRPSTSEANNQLQYGWDSNTEGTVGGAGGSNISWTEYSYIFTAVNAVNNVTRVHFTDVGTADSLGTFIDNVSVECLGPEILPVCGDGKINQEFEECDGLDGVAEGRNFCTNTCKLIPVYDGGHVCPQGTTRSQNPIVSTTVSSTDPDGQNISLSGGKTYLFEASGDYGYGGDTPNNTINRADAGYATGDAWLTRRDNLLGIPATAQYRGITSLLSDMGTGTVGLVDWGAYNSDNVYQKAYDASGHVKFVISDWYDTWYSGDAASDTNKEQGGMWDNAGSLTLNVYECQEYGSITAHKYVDDNRNGSLDSGEVGKEGWLMSLYSGENCLGTAMDSGLTDVNGDKTFSSLSFGQYSVMEESRPGWENEQNLCQNIDLNTSVPQTINYGNFEYGKIQGMKYNDLNQNGIRNAGEAWLNDWKIRLYARDGAGGWQGPSEHITGETGILGQYRFEDLSPGTYYICEVLTPGWIQTSPVLGGNKVANQSPNSTEEGSVCWKIVINGSSQFATGKHFGNQRNPVTIKTYKVVCDSEADLPNWGGIDGSGINANTAQNFVDNSNGKCRYGDGWDFQWGFADKDSAAGVDKLIGAHIGPADGTVSSCSSNCGSNTNTGTDYNDWKTFGSTDSNNYGMTEISINDLEDAPGIWVRENLKPDYVPFTYPPKGGTEDNVSAEIYCHNDRFKYDNYDLIDSPQYGQTYYCVAFNALNLGTINIKKDVNPDYADGGPEWSFDILGTDLDSGGWTLGDQHWGGINLPPGDYSVSETPGPGVDPNDSYKSTYRCFDSPILGDQSETGTEILSGEGTTTPVFTVQPNHTVFCKFTNTELSSFAGKKYIDYNADGQYNNADGDTLYEGWTIKLYKHDGINYVYLTETTTDSNGEYLFENLEAGMYRINEDINSSYVVTDPNEFGHYNAVLLQPGQDLTGFDFGNFKLGAIQGRKYQDDNLDGSYQSNEPWLGGWTVNLYDNSWTNVGTIVTAGTTGLYRFENLTNDTYYTCEVLQNGWKQTGPVLGSNRVVNQSPNSEYEGPVCWKSVINASGQSRTGRQFGNVNYGSVEVTKYNDIDGDGEWDDGEEVLSGWEINLTGQTSLMTDVDGKVEFANLVSDQYILSETPQAGWFQTGITCDQVVPPVLDRGPQISSGLVKSVFAQVMPPIGSLEVTVNPGETTQCYIGNFEYGKIEGYKYKDINDNGVLDSGETGIEGWEMCLTKEGLLFSAIAVFDQADDQQPECFDKVWTDVNGHYEFTGLTAGIYNVTEELRSGWTPSNPADGKYEGIEIKSGTGVGVENLRYDFFNAPPASLLLSKTNDHLSGVSVGDLVTYSLAITVGQRTLSEMTLVDNLPEGFVYQAGSATVSGGAIVSVEPTLSNSDKTLTWTWGEVLAGSTIIVTYQIIIDSANQAASYTNYAWVSGRGSPTMVESEIVDSTVTLGPVYSFSVGIGGAVLGASTGEVLGAVLPAAGSETWYLILAMAMILTGLGMKLVKCHCEDRRDEAISFLDCFEGKPLAMTKKKRKGTDK